MRGFVSGVVAGTIIGVAAVTSAAMMMPGMKYPMLRMLKKQGRHWLNVL